MAYDTSTQFQLKNIYNKEYISAFSNVLKSVYPSFNKKQFAKSVFDKDWDARELKQRMRHITECLYQVLPQKFKESAPILIKLTDALMVKIPNESVPKKEDGLNFEAMFLPDYIEQYGQDDFKMAVKVIEKVTQYTSAEFAVRPFLVKYPEKMLAQMIKWANHKNYWVRRLASEGSRPRLPWGMALTAYKKDPTPILPILEKLKEDSASTVRRSVANNLNDIAKDNPDTVVKIAKKWHGKSVATDKLVKHACRTLLKQGNTEVLLIFGFGNPQNISVQNLQIEPTKIKIGNEAHFDFDLLVGGKKDVKLRLEYAVYFVKSNGSLSRKIFQLSEKVFEGGKTYSIKRKQHFKNLTTRKHYVGLHQLAVVVNGVEKEKIEFELV